MSITNKTTVSDIKTYRSKNSKKNLGESFFKSLKTCCRCHFEIPTISVVINDVTPLPPVIADIIASFMTKPKQPIGYVNLHYRTRRRYHVICTTCYEQMTDTFISVNNRTYGRCPASGCKIDIDIVEKQSNTLDDPLPK